VLTVIRKSHRGKKSQQFGFKSLPMEACGLFGFFKTGCPAINRARKRPLGQKSAGFFGKAAIVMP